MGSLRPRQLGTAVIVAGALAAGGFGVSQLGDDSATPTAVATLDNTIVERHSNESDEPTIQVVSASEGEAARARFANLRGTNGAAVAELASASLASTSSAAFDDVPVGECGEPWVPSDEEVAELNADTEGLAAALESAGILITRSTDSNGFVSVEYDYEDEAAQDVAERYWFERYPPEPIDPDELAENVRINDALAAALDAVGVTYERTTDLSGWESLEYDYDNPAANEAVDAAYAEIFPPEPPSAEMIEQMQADNDQLAAAFTEAGIAHTLVRDEIGWEWIEWDVDDEATNAAVMDVFDSLYPVDELVDPAVLLPVEPVEVDPATSELVVTEPALIIDGCE